ncbi:MAG TPA: hypothetical protein VFX84_00710 [Candidatus Saccharimonadales bacterium]|nr:hypothetical protein [Candidatus Saccharimonadales bacterium]
MKSAEAVGVVQAGATGVVADMFREYAGRPDSPFSLEAVATANHPELHGKRLGEAGIDVPSSLEDVPVISMTDAIENTDAPLVFSGLQTKIAARYEDRLAAGRLVVTNASANRERPDVPVVSAFTNPQQIDQLFARDMEGRIIAGGNCMAAIMSVPLAPIHRAIGIESMAVSTMQGWSGAGLKELPEDPGTGHIPIEGDEQKKIQTEPNEFLSPDMDIPEAILIGAEPRRGPWLRGHHAQMALTLARDTSKQEIEALWRGFEAPEELGEVRSQIRAVSQIGGDKWPKRHQPIRPVKLEHGGLLFTNATPNRLNRIQPMRVHAHIMGFDPVDPRRVVLEVAGDNLIQGAAGGNILNAIYARSQGYI